MNAKTEIPHWAKKDEPAVDPKSVLSHFPVERSEHRILGDLGAPTAVPWHRRFKGFSGSGLEFVIAVIAWHP
jgi:hypothetical protein